MCQISSYSLVLENNFLSSKFANVRPMVDVLCSDIWESRRFMRTDTSKKKTKSKNGAIGRPSHMRLYYKNLSEATQLTSRPQHIFPNASKPNTLLRDRTLSFPMTAAELLTRVAPLQYSIVPNPFRL